MSHETAHVRDICVMTPNNESFDWFDRIISVIYMVSQQLIIQCDVYSVLFTYQTNRNIARTKKRYGKTIDGVPLSGQEFFQIRQT